MRFLYGHLNFHKLPVLVQTVRCIRLDAVLANVAGDQAASRHATSLNYDGAPVAADRSATGTAYPIKKVLSLRYIPCILP